MSEQIKKSQWSLFQYFGMFFCFFAFPLFVINSSLTNLLELKLANHKQQVFSELSDQLKLFAPFNDERRYFHLMLQKVMELANKSKNPVKYLEKAIARLKQNHPGRLEFIVWDKKGQIIDHLTDEKRFRFVLKKLWSVFDKVTRHINDGEVGEIKNIETVKTNYNLAKQFLGRVFLPETLRYPYLTDDSGSVILADYGKDRPYFWYQTGANIGLLCFLNWDAVKGDKGLRNIVNAINKADNKTVTGFASLHNLSEPYLPQGAPMKSEIILALAKYENSAEQMAETDHAQIGIQMLNPHTRVFAYKLKEADVYFPDQQRHKALVQFVTIYLIGYGLLFFNFRIRKAFFSIRWKLLLLFLYANVAPLLVLGSIAYDYLQNKEVTLKSDIQLDSARLLRDMDTRFSLHIADYELRLNKLVNEINNGLVENSNLTGEGLKHFQKQIELIAPNEFFLINKKGETILAIGEDGKNVSHSTSYVKNLAEGMLNFHNRIIVAADKSDVLSKIMAPEHSDFIRNSIKESGKIWPMIVGDVVKIAYWALIGDRLTYNNNYFALLLWDESDFQRNFLQQYFANITGKHKDRLIFAKIIDKSGIYPRPEGDSSSIEAVLAAAEKSGNAIHSSVKFAQKEYTVTALHGKKMNQTALIAMFPRATINQKITQLRRNILAGTLFSLLLTTIISLAFARQFLEPVKTLGLAAKAVARHDFRHRIDIREKDEFGHLGQVMNRMIEGLGELEIARVVQESLLPDEAPQVKPFEIFGKSTVMTALGGDYYDFINIDAEHFGAIIGDVSGHGISAALIMAMAKAGVKMAGKNETTNPAVLLESIHEILYSLKNKKLQRMMTFQYLVINKVSGETSFANAGHCYPLLINSTSRKAEFIKQSSLPLGICRNPKYETIKFTVGPEESLILFTDGIVEAQNSKGEFLGYDGLAELAMRNYTKNAREFYGRMFEAYTSWAGTINDDLTIIVINNHGQNNV